MNKIVYNMMHDDPAFEGGMRNKIISSRESEVKSNTADPFMCTLKEHWNDQPTVWNSYMEATWRLPLTNNAT